MGRLALSLWRSTAPHGYKPLPSLSQELPLNRRLHALTTPAVIRTVTSLKQLRLPAFSPTDAAFARRIRRISMISPLMNISEQLACVRHSC